MESKHQPLKNIRTKKRTSVNTKFTMISHDEQLSAYHATGQMLPSVVEKTILKVCSDKVVLDYQKMFKVPGNKLHLCSKLSVFSTDYYVGQYIVLPSSTNAAPKFGKIQKLLSCTKFAYFMYKKTQNVYCPKSDLYIITEDKDCDLVPQHKLPCYYPLNAYDVGQPIQTTISMKHYILEHLRD